MLVGSMEEHAPAQTIIPYHWKLINKVILRLHYKGELYLTADNKIEIAHLESL